MSANTPMTPYSMTPDDLEQRLGAGLDDVEDRLDAALDSLVLGALLKHHEREAEHEREEDRREHVTFHHRADRVLRHDTDQHLQEVGRLADLELVDVGQLQPGTRNRSRSSLQAR